MRSFARCVSVVGLVVGALGGCSRPEAPASAPPTIRIGASLPTQGPADTGFSALVSYFVTEPLFSMGQDGKPTPRLARGWQWTDGRTRLRLELQPGVFFHDGTPLTATLAAQLLSREVSRRDLSYQSVESVTPIGTDTVEIRLSRPEAFLLEDLATFSVTLPENRRVGTGPFELVSSTSSGRLKAFDRYRRGKPAIHEIEFKRYSSLRSAWAAMMRGEIDGVHEVSREAADFVEEESSARSYPFLRPYYVALTFNMRHPVLGRAEVRRALTEAVDKEEVVASGLRGRGKSAEGPIWPYHWALAKLTKPKPHDAKAAQQKLEDIGLHMVERRDGNAPSRFSFNCLVWAEDSRYERIALILQKQFFDIGVDMKLEPVTMQQFATRAMTGKFDAFLMEMASNRSLSYVYRFWHSPTQAVLLNSGYSAADSILDRLRHSTSDEETRAAAADLQRILRDDPPAIFLAWQETTRAISANFSVPVEENRDVMSTIWRWRLIPPAEAAAQDP
jgi:peptide/nickel transport system substrate-binding protein